MAKSGNECDSLDVASEPCFPEHVREKMAELSLEKQRLLYLDIFKPLDFYEILFEKYFNKTKEEKSTTETTTENTADAAVEKNQQV